MLRINSVLVLVLVLACQVLVLGPLVLVLVLEPHVQILVVWYWYFLVEYLIQDCSEQWQPFILLQVLSEYDLHSYALFLC